MFRKLSVQACYQIRSQVYFEDRMFCVYHKGNLFHLTKLFYKCVRYGFITLNTFCYIAIRFFFLFFCILNNQKLLNNIYKNGITF